jgi:tRNA pseudouridine55 synthase
VLVDKPAGMTSHDVVQRVRRALGIRAAGHTGTLDPFATGLLVILVGRATRLARFVEGQPKTYLATARLGIRTSTDDLTGRVLETSESGSVVPELQVHEALAAFQGTQLQRPPPYSAKRVGGERSYRRARRGEAVELADVSVTVHRIEQVEYRPPELRFRAVVSAGTYIRALARDLGERLGVGAHLTELRREAIGTLRVESAVTLDRLDPTALIPAGAVLANLPSVDLDETARDAVAHGRAVVDSGAAGRRGSGDEVALLAAGQLIGVAEAVDGWLRPKVVLETV